MRLLAPALASLQLLLSATGLLAAETDKLLQQAEQHYLQFGRGNESELAKAHKAGDKLIASAEGAELPEAWILRARIYMSIEFYRGRTDRDRMLKWTDKVPDAAKIALEATVRAGLMLEAGHRTAARDPYLDWLLRILRDVDPETEGNRQRQKGKLAEALKLYRAAIGIKMVTEAVETPSTRQFEMKTRLLQKLVDAALELKQWPVAARHLELLKWRDSRPMVFHALHSVFTQLGNADKALKYLAEGRQLHPNDRELLFAELGHVTDRRDYSRLVELLPAAMQHEPDNPKLAMTLGYAHASLMNAAVSAGDLQKAEAHARSAIDTLKGQYERQPNDRLVRLLLGTVHINISEFLCRDRTAGGAPTSSSENGSPGPADRGREHARQALPHLQHLEGLDPNDSDVLQALGLAYQLLGDREQSQLFTKRLAAVKEGRKHDQPVFPPASR